MLLAVGSKIKDGVGNDYILDSVLGQGGFGCVYKAHRENDGYDVAVKTLLSTFHNETELLSFQKEVVQAKLISSDHVIKYLYIHDGSVYTEYPPYIIMEFADGGTLADVIEKQRPLGSHFDLGFIQDAIKQLSEGMKDISKYLVHRDIKPENILIKDGILKISDFGLSKLSEDTTHTLTFKGYGTAKYVAPEGWNNKKNTIQMDIYSMGIVFYELATLEYPYQIKANADLVEYQRAHLYDIPKNPYNLNPSLPQSLVSTIIRMIEKPTQKRFNSWDDIINTLSIKPTSSDNVNLAVTKALAKRNATDLKEQEAMAEEERVRQEEENVRCLVFSQYESTIFKPINQFVENFNAQYAGTSQFDLKKDFSPHNDYFSYTITTPSLERILIKTEIIFAKNYQKEIPVDRHFRELGYRIVNYIPQCKQRDVLAWSQVSDQTGRGFNILLLKSEDSMYGDWYVLRNTNSALSRHFRAEPFGFNLEELPKEINNINVTHIYNINLLDFNESMLLQLLVDQV